MSLGPPPTDIQITSSKKAIDILIHVLPTDLLLFHWTVLQLKKNSLHVDPDFHVRIEAVLNCNLANWSKSTVSKATVQDLFHQLAQVNQDWAECVFEVNEDGSVRGCNDQRRRHARRAIGGRYTLLIDPDLVFGEYLLRHLQEGIKTITAKHSSLKYWVLTPQIPQCWDLTWRDLVHIAHRHEPANLDFYKQRDPFACTGTRGPVSLSAIHQFKFAGGWATLMPSELPTYVDIPDALGCYSLDDTFVMLGAQMMANHGYAIKQFVLQNEVVNENNRYRLSFLPEILPQTNEFRRIGHDHIMAEMARLENRLRHERQSVS